MLSWNPGDVHLILICFYPDALRTLTGIDPYRYEQSFVDVSEIFSGGLRDAVLSMQEPGSERERFERFQDMIAPIWASKRPRGMGLTKSVSDWARLAIMRTALSQNGKSIRAFERKMRSMFGMSKRELNVHAKAEDTFALAFSAQKSGALDLAALAGEAGFADQSHMGRLTKRVTGHSPDQLMRRIENDETYWSYRLIGEHITAQK